MLVGERGPKPKERVVIETVGFINVPVFSEVRRALEEPHLYWAVEMAAEAGQKSVKYQSPTKRVSETSRAGFSRRGAGPVERGGVTGHEEEDVWLQGAGDAVDVTKSLEVAHDVQGASLVDQAGVEACSEVAHQQEERSGPPPRFQTGQRYSCRKTRVKSRQWVADKDGREKPTGEEQTEGQHRVDEAELFMRKETEAGKDEEISFGLLLVLGHMGSLKRCYL